MRKINIYAASVGRRFGETAENFGDNLMQPLLREVFDLDVEFVTHRKADLIGVGSILDSYFRRHKGRQVSFINRRPWKTLHVWGSGFMDTHSEAIWPQKLKFHAVRGPLSASKIGKPDIPQGDPAILLSKIWPSKATKKHEVGIIPHFATYKAFEQAYEAALPKHWKIIDLMGNPKDICGDISSCEIIVSSSLHGLIVADTYGVPSKWILPENAIKGDGFKFRDYQGQRGVNFTTPVHFSEILQNGLNLEELTLGKPSENTIDEIISCFPYK
jgi:hypothetical protein